MFNNINGSINLNGGPNGMHQIQLNPNQYGQENESNVIRKFKLYYENHPNFQFKLNIFFYEVLLPKFCILSKKRKKRMRQYQILKNYVLNKLCISNFLKNTNELEKIKYFFYTSEDLNHFNSLINPLPWSQHVDNIWINDKQIEQNNFNVIPGVV